MRVCKKKKNRIDHFRRRRDGRILVGHPIHTRCTNALVMYFDGKFYYAPPNRCKNVKRTPGRCNKQQPRSEETMVGEEEEGEK